MKTFREPSNIYLNIQKKTIREVWVERIDTIELANIKEIVHIPEKFPLTINLKTIMLNLNVISYLLLHDMPFPYIIPT